MVVFEIFYSQVSPSSPMFKFKVEATPDTVFVEYLGRAGVDDASKAISSSALDDFFESARHANRRGLRMQNELKLFHRERNKFYACSHCGDLFYQVTGEPPDGGSRICPKCCDE